MLKTDYSLGMGGGISGYPTMIAALTSLGLTSDLKLCLDAGDANSYTSGQSWLDTSGGGYDFHFGATGSSGTDDPSFNGTAGGLSNAEYMSTAGGDFFEYDQTTPETWMNNMHKNNAIVAIACWIYPDALTQETRMWSTNGGSVGTRIGTNYRGETTSGNLALYVGRSDGEFKALKNTADTALSVDEWNFVGYSLNEATGSGGGFHYLNGAYNQVSSSDTFTSTYSSPTSSDISGDPSIMGDSRESTQAAFPSGGRYAMLAVWEGGTQISKANFDSIYALTNRDFRTQDIKKWQQL